MLQRFSRESLQHIPAHQDVALPKGMLPAREILPCGKHLYVAVSVIGLHVVSAGTPKPKTGILDTIWPLVNRNNIGIKTYSGTLKILRF
jgi:hypothetical protein